MKKSYFFFLFFAIYLHSYAQSNCAKSNTDVVYGYSHLKTADSAVNLENLKLWSSRALESFILVKTKSGVCSCEKSYVPIKKIVELLNKVKTSESLIESQGNIKKSRSLAKDVIKALQKCTETELRKYSSR